MSLVQFFDRATSGALTTDEFIEQYFEMLKSVCKAVVNLSREEGLDLLRIVGTFLDASPGVQAQQQYSQIDL